MVWGLAAAVVIAACGGLLAASLGGPALVYALILGIVANASLARPRYAQGLSFAASPLLRLGVALLGLQVSLQTVMALGWQPLVLVAFGVPTTIFASLLLGRWLGVGSQLALVGGASVAICGASAAVAVASILPREQRCETRLSFVIVGVTVLSTLAMILYPVLSAALGLNAFDAGLWFGSAIHDVAHVVGAGYSVDPTAGDVATLTKLARVAALLPVVLIISALWRRNHGSNATGERPPLLPWFLVTFALLALSNSVVNWPDWLREAAAHGAKASLLVAIAAIGTKVNPRALLALGPKPAILLGAVTLLLAGQTLLLIGLV